MGIGKGVVCCVVGLNIGDIGGRGVWLGQLCVGRTEGREICLFLVELRGVFGIWLVFLLMGECLGPVF